MANKKRLFTPVLLNKSHNTSSFDCGVTVLNNFLQNYALQNLKNSSVKTFVAIESDCNNLEDAQSFHNKVVGYYSLVAGSVEHSTVPPRIKKGLGKYPIPVILIARLAVDISMQGQGLGKGLLKDALLRVLNITENLGVRAILVHAKDEKAKNFYRQFGFESSPNNKYHLYLLVQDIQATLT